MQKKILNNLENSSNKINDKYSFIINKDIDFSFSIFDNNKFIDLHSNNYKSIYKYLFIENKTQKYIGSIVFALTNDNYIKSPLNGSYGGFEFNNDLDFFEKENMILKVLSNIYSKNPKGIDIVLPPDIYNSQNNTHQLSILLRDNFHINHIEINQFIDIKKYDLNKTVKYGNRKNINKCLKKNLKFELLKMNQYRTAYEIIKFSRQRKNYHLSMNWDDLIIMINNFKDNFIIFGLFEEEFMIASAFCIKISSKILYVFYWGELDGYEKISPISYLSYELTNFCKENNYQILDLGTSSKDSIPNIGLINFKRSLGGKICNKFKLTKLIKH